MLEEDYEAVKQTLKELPPFPEGLLPLPKGGFKRGEFALMYGLIRPTEGKSMLHLTIPKERKGNVVQGSDTQPVYYKG